MNAPTVSARAKRAVSLSSIGGVGVVLSGIFIRELVDGSVFGLEAMISAYSLVFAVGLVGSAGWLHRQAYAADDLVRITGWMFVGATPIAFVTWLVLVTQAPLGFWRLLADIASVTTIGALGGLVTGIALAEERRTTAQLKQTERRLASILEASPLAIVAADADGVISTWNQAAEQVFGWSADEAIGTELTGTTTAADFEDLLTRFQNGELRGGIEEQRVTKTGETVQLRTHYSPIYDDANIVAGGMAVLNDITDQKERAARLRRTRELLRWTETMADVGGWEWNLDTGDLQWTEGTRRIHGVDDDFDPDMDTTAQFFHPDDRELVFDLIEQLLHAEESFGMETRLITANGEERWVEILGSRDVTEAETPVLRGAMRDISEQKQHEQRLMVLNRVLRHNLRNDLNVILGRAELLHDDLRALDGAPVLDSDTDLSELGWLLSGATEDSGELHGRISRVVELVELLSAFPTDRAQTDAKTIIQRSSDLAATGEKARKFDHLLSSAGRGPPDEIAVDELLERILPRHRQQSPHASIAAPADSDVTIRGRPPHVEAAIDELVENAIEHNLSETPQVEVTATQSGNQARISVADNGPGIPEVERETMQRGEETPLMHGQGMGLWLVNWIVGRLGGSLSIEGNDPSGTIVRLTFPAA